MSDGKVQQLADSPWLAVIGRFAMIVISALISLTLFFGKSWINDQFDTMNDKVAAVEAKVKSVDSKVEEIGPLRERVVVLETNQAAGRSDQENFQRQVIARMDRFQDAIITLSNTVASLTATIKADRDNERRGSP